VDLLMPPDEFDDWLLWFTYRAQEQEKALKAAKAKSKQRR